MQSRTACVLSIGLGLLSLLAVIACQLALTDVYHGEQDLTLEWNVLRVSFVVIIAFQVSALLTLWRVLGIKPKP